MASASSRGLIGRLLTAAAAGFAAVTLLTLLGPSLFSNFRPPSFGLETFLPAWVIAALGLPSLLGYAVAAWRSCRFATRAAAFLVPAACLLGAFVTIAVWARMANVNEAELVFQVYLMATLCHTVSQTAMGAALMLSERRAMAVM